MSEYISKKLRKQVKERANRICEYCHALSDFAFHNFEVDHILPVSKRGLTILMNLAYACVNCNKCKYNRIEGKDPQSNFIVELFNPRIHIWENHFVWNNEETVIIGITPIGRATVVALKMNRPETVNLRKVLVEFGVHPPR